MKKSLLIKNIKNQSISSKEKKEIAKWINKSELNRKYYVNLINLIALTELHNDNNLLNENEVDKARKKIHDKINKNISISRNAKSIFYKISTFAAIGLLLLSILTNIYQAYNPKILEKEIIINKVPAKNDIIYSYYTEKGVKGKIVLPDGSEVWLNSDSRITYPNNFDSDKRRIKFEGEGYFKIQKDSLCPMEIKTPKGMKIEVLGTSFHLRSYDNEVEEQATLFHGKIEISKTQGNKKILDVKTIKPGESLYFSRKNKIAISHSVDTTKKIAWKNGKLIFDETPIKEAAKMLERWHGYKIIINDSKVLSNKYSATFKTESIIQILELFKYTSPIDYKIYGKNVYIETRKIKKN